MPKTNKGQGTGSKIYAVILVGGKGKRLRPLSTDSRPKAFLSITKDRKTMFRGTVDRAKKIVPSNNIVVVANRIHSRLVKKDFPGIGKKNLILEPVSRNTAPAIALAALILKKRVWDAIIAALPTDQYIIDEKKYLNSVRRGIGFVNNNGDALIVLGVKPKYPATEFGYMRVKKQGARGKGVYKVEKFIEKPDLATAKRYVKSGQYLWNTGAFIFRASAILRAVKRFAPEIFKGLEKIDNIGASYWKLPGISIDYAVMEKAENIYCVEGSYRWQDMGSFESLKSILKRESRDFIVKDGKVVKIL